MFKAVIIDDEQGAINALTLLLERHISNIEIVVATTDCTQGIQAIDTHQPDVVFLDISMPDMNGFTLLQRVSYKNFKLIIITAHERYAIKALRHHASDYLLKPIDIDELKHAIESLSVSETVNKTIILSRRVPLSGRLSLPIRDGMVYLNVADIVWIESDGNYCTFYMSDRNKYMVSKNIGEYEEVLPSGEFFRAHKSHLINIRKVKKYIRTDGYFVEMENGSVVEIARRKKDDFLELMNSINGMNN